MMEYALFHAKALLEEALTGSTHCQCDFIPDFPIPEDWQMAAIQANYRMYLDQKRYYPTFRMFNPSCWPHHVAAFLEGADPVTAVAPVLVPGDRVKFGSLHGEVVEPSQDGRIEHVNREFNAKFEMTTVKFDRMFTLSGVPWSTGLVPSVLLEKI